METLAVTPDQFDEIIDLAQFAHKGTVALSKNGQRAFFIEIGPELANKILDTYDLDYRKLRDKHAKSIASDMAEGAFLLDGSPIRISKEKKLLDGQHRMFGIRESGQRLEFLIVDSLPPDTYDTVDTNIVPRTYIDILRRRGYSNPTGMSALIKLAHKWYNPKITSLATTYPQTPHQLDKILNQYADRLKWATHNARNLDKKIYVPQSQIALAMFILGEISESSIKGFMISVAEGENIHRGMPAYTLKTRLQGDHNEEKDKSRDIMDTMWLIFRTWKMYHQNLSRHDGDQLTIFNLPVPRNGVSIRDLKNMMASE